MSVGKMTFFVMIFTFLMCFGGGYFVRKIFKLNWKLGNLISAGTGICGGSAVAAIAPVIDADDKDIAFATMVKLTRTIAIIPTVLVFAFVGTRMKQKELQTAGGEGKKVNIVKIIPWFICGFLALAIINSLGWIPTMVSGVMKTTSKFLMVSALAAIGLGTSITDFKKAGLAPMFYGVTIDTLVTLTALGVIWLMGLM